MSTDDAIKVPITDDVAHPVTELERGLGGGIETWAFDGGVEEEMLGFEEHFEEQRDGFQIHDGVVDMEHVSSRREDPHGAEVVGFLRHRLHELSAGRDAHVDVRLPARQVVLNVASPVEVRLDAQVARRAVEGHLGVGLAKAWKGDGVERMRRHHPFDQLAIVGQRVNFCSQSLVNGHCVDQQVSA